MCQFQGYGLPRVCGIEESFFLYCFTHVIQHAKPLPSVLLEIPEVPVY
jgi:hypothetical protein